LEAIHVVITTTGMCLPVQQDLNRFGVAGVVAGGDVVCDVLIIIRFSRASTIIEAPLLGIRDCLAPSWLFDAMNGSRRMIVFQLIFVSRQIDASS
jgi:hypothetical protein